jgi:hypothetical protein
MKTLIAILSFIMIILTSCKRDITPEVPANVNFSQEIKDCFVAKELPNLSKGDIWIEGEIDGKTFSISPSKNMSIRSTLRNFWSLGYQKEYARTYEAQGNGLSIYPVSDTVPIPDKYNFVFNVNFPAFQGDSLAYLQYFNQFQKGKNFKFRTGDVISLAGELEPETVEISAQVFGGCSPVTTNGRGITSFAANQTGSYFRVADVKEYKSGSLIYRRDVTMEFDVKLGVGEVLRIKNGRLFFSY